MKLFASFLLAASALAFVPMSQAADPSLHEVYQAVHDGRLSDAQSMMTKVLRDRPDSAKAHYVEAEVLVRMDRAVDARAELETAERLAPGLSFAKPEAVRDLRGLIAERSRVIPTQPERSSAAAPQSSADSGFPWGIVLLIAGGGLMLFLFLRARQSAVVPVAGGGSLMGPAGTPYGGVPYGPAPMGGGIGSGIVGGLATGAALGAGMVAGEALAHEFIGNHDRDRVSSDPGVSGGSRVPYDDGGGPDFGVSDAGSWDSGSGGDISGGGDGGGGDWG